GGPEALAEFLALARLPVDTDVLGPVGLEPSPSDEPVHRLTLRAPRTAGRALVRAVSEVAAIRSARKSDGALRVVVDPVGLG
ncbi:MAG TPA: primosome assembly protein PriA, partial [Propionibacteriaceae bacterium]|nr:primosome assembly protein PriA [Propionibacteriaceae bacterium]